MTTSATAGTGNEIGTDFRLRVVIVKGSSVFVQPVNRFPYHDVSGKHEQRVIVVWLGFVNTGVDVITGEDGGCRGTRGGAGDAGDMEEGGEERCVELGIGGVVFSLLLLVVLLLLLLVVCFVVMGGGFAGFARLGVWAVAEEKEEDEESAGAEFGDSTCC